MRLLELHLKAYGPFTNQVLHLGSGEQRLVLIQGPNEAGKSSALRAIAGLRFQIDERSPDRFIHDYPQMRIGGVFVDAQGRTYSLMRRKGRGNTLHWHDFNTDKEIAEPVPPQVNSLLTGGFSLKDYPTMFGIDHASLRRGGKALASGEGDVGAALFEASSGTANIAKLLEELDASARRHFLPGANARNATINQALHAYKDSSDLGRRLQVKPTHWERLEREAQDTQAALGAAQAAHQALVHGQLRVTELLAVSPSLAALTRAESELSRHDDVHLLPEDAAAQYAAASAGLTDARANALSAAQAAGAAQAGAAAITLDTALLAAGAAIGQLHAAIPVIVQLQTERGQAQADEAQRSASLAALGRSISADQTADELLSLAPSATTRVELVEAVAALESAAARLALHLESAGAHSAAPQALPEQPDAASQLTLRVVLGEVARADAQLQRLARLPGELSAAQRRIHGEIAALGLPSEDDALRVSPVLNAKVDDEVALRSRLATQHAGLEERIQAMSTELARQKATIAELLAHGSVPTRDDLRQARAQRDQAWARLRAAGGPGPWPDTGAGSAGQPLPLLLDYEAYEAAVAGADGIVDSLLQHYERASALELARLKVSELHDDLQARRDEIRALDPQAAAADAAWHAALSQAGIPAMPPTQLRDWQTRLGALKPAVEALASQREELAQLQELQRELVAKLRVPIERLALTPIGAHESLDTLVVVGDENLRELEARKTARSQAQGQAAQLQRQQALHAGKQAELEQELAAVRSRLDPLAASVLLAPGASAAVVRSRIAQFDALLEGAALLGEASARLATKRQLLQLQEAAAAAIAHALGEAVPAQLTLAAGEWASRLARAQADASTQAAALQRAQAANAQREDHQAAVNRHQATLDTLCSAAQVGSPDALPAALEISAQKRQLTRDVAQARALLAQASSRSRSELQTLLAGQDGHSLRAQETALATQLDAAAASLETARAAHAAARHALQGIDASGAAAEATDDAARAAASVRQALPLLMRTRLAHALLQEAVRRFKQRTQAPMLLAASRYFAEITGGEFDALCSDDSDTRPVIKARRPGSDKLLGVDALSEGTLDQLYLALRLAALELQRTDERNLPLVLDDVLMTSDDARAGCILRALATFARGGQVIVFTHHGHLCEVARSSVDASQLAVVELRRA